MARVATTTDYIDLDGDHGVVPGVSVTCRKCGHAERSDGCDETAQRRCAALLRENCPRREKNHYVVT